MNVLARLSLAVALLAAPAAVSDDGQYRIGAGDVLTVSIRAGTEVEPIDLTLTVAGDGRIDVVHAGTVKVSGLTTGQVRDRIIQRLRDREIFKDPNVAVNVAEYLSQAVNVTGFVETPGRYFLRGPTRLLDIVSQAEGIKEESAADVIHVFRQGVAEPIVVRRGDLFGADLAARSAADIQLEAGDTVHVPRKAQFCVLGPVEDPGCHPMPAGATIIQALSIAKGLDNDAADRTAIKVRRAGKADLLVDLNAVERGDIEPPVLSDGDQILVPVLRVTSFCVLGPVEEPDCYDWKEGTTLEAAISTAGGLVRDTADRGSVNVRRERDGTQVEFELDLDDPTPAGSRFPIEAGDQIIVGEVELYITVSGTVREPGKKDWFRGMKITDAIAEAGGEQTDTFGGNLKKVTLRRDGQIREINVRRIQKGKDQDVPLEPGDSIYVPRSMF